MHWWLLNLLIILRITNSQVCHSRDEHTSETSTELRNNILEKKNILHIICIRSQQTKYIHVHYINHIYICKVPTIYSVYSKQKRHQQTNELIPFTSRHHRKNAVRRNACSFRRHIWASSRPQARKPACFRSISGLKTLGPNHLSTARDKPDLFNTVWIHLGPFRFKSSGFIKMRTVRSPSPCHNPLPNQCGWDEGCEQ